MKKMAAGIILLIMFLVGCAGGAKPAAGSGGKTLDQAIAQAAVRIDESIEAGTKIALLNFNSSSDLLSSYVLDELTANIVDNKKITVVDRAEIDLIRAEFAFQLSGEVADDSMQELGRMLGAQSIVSGSLTAIGGSYRIVIRVLNVQTAAVAVQYRADIPNDERMQALLAGKKPDGIAATKTPVQPPQTAAQKPAPAQPVQPAAKPETAVPANFVRINGGTFTMGSPANEPSRQSNEVQHTVTVKSFSIGKYEVTQKEWQDVMGTNPSNWKGDNLPVEQVSWYEAVEYCNKRSLKENLTPAYRGSGSSITCDWNANGYRLPTEAEWEFAARGGTKDYLSTEYSGSNSVDTVAWYTGNSGGRTHEVGTKAANALGIHDMSGNVWEWCWDWFVVYTSEAQIDPAGAADAIHHVLRGGAWSFTDEYAASVYRHLFRYRLHNTIGFRVVLPEGEE
jgi:formylglycine-generating enzyme required for sulfatase activity